MEVIPSGVLGTVSEAHVWTNRPIWIQGFDVRRPAGSSPVPSTLKWDLWLGVASERPFVEKIYAPHEWRGWVDFGTGALGDMACHTVNLPFMALKLGYPTYAVAENSGYNGETYPKSSKIMFEFPARDGMAPVKLFWYDGGSMPPETAFGGREVTDTGSLIISDKATFFAPGDSGYAAENQLWPEEKFADYKPPTLPRVRGELDKQGLKQHTEWIDACKGNGAPLSNFDYSGFLTETMLLGNLAVRSGHPIEWDGPGMRVKNCPEAQNWVRRECRKGWEWL